MHTVVNRLTFREPVDPRLFLALDELGPAFAAIDGFEAAHAVQTGPREVVLLIVGHDEEALDRIATEVGTPWMMRTVVPLLAGPPERVVGPVVASTRYPPTAP